MNFQVLDLGLSDYQQAFDFQKDLHRRLINGSAMPSLIICSHNPVITLGRSADRSNLKVAVEFLSSRQIQLREVDRGGDITYHGPGQILVYPVMNLSDFSRDLHLYLRWLEQLVINFLSHFSITGRRLTGKTGVWVDNGKISSIGIGVRNWISYHGLAINVKRDDLENFSLIRPCGMDIPMTSMETVLNQELALDEVRQQLKRSVSDDQSDIAFLRRSLQ